MPLAVKDVVNSFVNKSDPFVRLTLRNPLLAALTLSIIFCLLLIWVFRDDDITKRRTKLVKVFVYTLCIATTIFFLQNSHLIKERSSKTDIVLPEGVLNGAGSDINTANSEYIKPELKINGGDDTNSVEFLIA